MSTPVTIPETITVHLGVPTAAAENITVPFAEYIKNVASSEIYPTWPEAAIRANVYAQVSYALNRVFTEWYRAQGYDFDITNSTRFDQSFLPGRNIFENISDIVDDAFDSYLVRGNNIEPFFAQYCNGTTTTCDGLSQWGTVALAEQGLTADQIIRRYYGEDIEFVNDAPVSPNLGGSWPGETYRLGDVGENIVTIQRRLNRISVNYPNIPKIDLTDGIYDAGTERAVRTFQQQFNLTADGVTGKATWYRIAFVYNNVLRLSELDSEGLRLSDVSRQYPEQLSQGMSGDPVRLLQYLLAVVGTYYDEVPRIQITGIFDDATRQAVLAYQQLVVLPETGIVDAPTWNALNETYRSVLLAAPSLQLGGAAPYPGEFLVEGMSGDTVRALQRDLNIIAGTDPQLSPITVDGVFGPATAEAVRTLQASADLPETGAVGPLTWQFIVTRAQEITDSARVAEGQFPGYVIGEEGGTS